MDFSEDSNYFLLNINGKVQDEHKINVKVLKAYEDSQRYNIYFNDKLIVKGGVDWREATLDGTPFASQTAFEEWVHLHTGFRTASGGSGAGIQSIVEGANITVDATDPNNPIISSLGGELEKITEGVNTGYALRGRTSANYGDIGSNAIDFSISNSASSTKGATGARSVAFGLNNTVASIDSIVVGNNNVIESQQKYSGIFGQSNTINNSATIDGWSFIFGELNTSRGGDSITFGWTNSNLGHSSGSNGALVSGFKNSSTLVGGIMSGSALHGDSVSTAVFGQANLTYTGSNGTVNTLTDPIFIVGNGTITSTFGALVRSDAFKILLNGTVTAPSLTSALINAEATGRVLTTRNYVDKHTLKGYTVATLPATPTQGDQAFVTDATAPTYLGTAVGGGAVVCKVFFDGTNWIT